MGLFKQLKQAQHMTGAAPVGIALAAPIAVAHPSTGAADMLSPIAGVTVEQYVRVVKGIAAYAYDQSMLPAIAAGLGIDVEAWETAAVGFNGRVSSNPAFAQHFNTVYRTV